MLIVRKNEIYHQEYHVCKYNRQGEYLGAVAGMGNNRGTWDTAAKSIRTAQRWAKLCRQDNPENKYRVKAMY